MRRLVAYFFLPILFADAAPADRITRAIELRETVPVRGHIHPVVQSARDRGPVDPSLAMNDVVLMFKPSARQQADLDRLLADQQNPSSPDYHRWLTPEEFGDRFGLSPSDHSKVVAWLRS